MGAGRELPLKTILGGILCRKMSYNMIFGESDNKKFREESGISKLGKNTLQVADHN